MENSNNNIILQQSLKQIQIFKKFCKEIPKIIQKKANYSKKNNKKKYLNFSLVCHLYQKTIKFQVISIYKISKKSKSI